MDIALIIALFSVFILIILGVIIFLKTTPKSQNEENAENEENDVPRRAQIARNQRARLRANARHLGNEADEDFPEQADAFSEEKIGAKKRAKLEAKAEKKAAREMEEKLREEKKVRDLQLEEERKKAEEKDKEIEEKQEEEERKVREEKERQEQEEYLKMKAAFSIEEEGYEEDEENEQSLGDFIKYIEQNKVIVIEDLAVHFKLKTQATIERLQDLQKDNRISGVIDDRGKFIYVSQEELKTVAKFIKQRGRVSIAELAESSNKLINLNPSKILTS